MSFTIIYIIIGGALGALSRYLFSLLISQGWMVWSTLLINILGCFIFGFFVRCTENILPPQHHIRAMVTVGFLGAFTTFSTFGYESALYLEKHLYYQAFLHFFSHNFFSILAMLIGLWLGGYFMLKN